MTEEDKAFEQAHPGKTGLDVFPMTGGEHACSRCSLEFKTMLHPFCQHRFCPPRELRQNGEAA